MPDQHGFEVDQTFREFASLFGFGLITFAAVTALYILAGTVREPVPETLWFPATLLGFGCASIAVAFVNPNLNWEEVIRV